MPNYKITELPHSYNNGEIIELAAFDYTLKAKRVNLSEFYCVSEEEAIERVKEIFKGNLQVLIIPYKPLK